jgi:hypothetical protein
MKSFFIFIIIFSISLINVDAQKKTLKFKNGKFKIVQFTDLHWIADEKFIQGNDSTLQLMSHVIKTENPDFVVFTGDVVVSKDAAKGWKEVTKILSDLKVPFVVVFGNHDTETDISKKQALKIIQSNPYNLTYSAGKKIDGIGNCSLPVKSSDGKKNKWILYFFDSNSQTQELDTVIKGYDWIKFNQIEWYRKQSTAYTKGNHYIALPALSFFHIPLPEFEYVRNRETTMGSKDEEVCAPYFNSGLFTSFVEMHDVLGIFVGHDHNNDFIGTAANICFGYGRKTGYNSAYTEILERGARVIELYENERKFDTYIRTMSGQCLFYTFERQ